jgi:HEAT repeat protein
MAEIKDSDPFVRADAIDALRQVEDNQDKEPAYPLVLAALKDPIASVRAEAAEALPAFSNSLRALHPLLKALRDPDPGVRRQAASSLLFIDDPRAIAPLAEALADGDAAVRATAADSLFSLLQSYSDPGLLEPELRARTVEALLVALRDNKAEVRRAAATTLGAVPDPKALPPLLAAMQDQDSSVRSEATLSIDRLRDRRALPALFVALKDQNNEVRWHAALGLYGLHRAGVSLPVDTFLEALEDPEPEVREWAAIILGEIGGKRAVEPLILHLALFGSQSRVSPGSDQSLACAALALGRIGDRRATAPLLPLLANEDPDVRRDAGWALGLLGDPKAKEPLLAALNGPDPRTHLPAALALAFMGDRRGTDRLVDALQSASEEERAQAAQALITVAREKPERLRDSIPQLIRSAETDSYSTRGDASWALRQMRFPEVDAARLALAERVQKRRPREALWALDGLKGPRATEIACSTLSNRNPSVRMQAADLLGENGEASAAQPLQGLLRDPHWGVRAHARVALQKIAKRSHP